MNKDNKKIPNLGLSAKVVREISAQKNEPAWMLDIRLNALEYFLESAMPTAVLCTVLATEYDVEPVFVTTAVVATTLFSPLVLTPLLAYLGA